MSIGSPTETGVLPRPSTRTDVGAAGAGAGALAAGGTVAACVGAGVDVEVGAGHAAEEMLTDVAGDDSPEAHDAEAAAPITQMTTDPMQRPPIGAPPGEHSNNRRTLTTLPTPCSGQQFQVVSPTTPSPTSRAAPDRSDLPALSGQSCDGLTSPSAKCYDCAMRGLVVVPVMAMTLAISACGDDDSSDEATTEETVAADVPDVIGDSVQDAMATLEEAGFTLRVVRRDGEDLPGTADFLENRVNVAVETQEDGTEVVTEVVSIG